MKKIIFHYWNNSKIPKVPSSEFILFCDDLEAGHPAGPGHGGHRVSRLLELPKVLERVAHLFDGQIGDELRETKLIKQDGTALSELMSFNF